MKSKKCPNCGKKLIKVLGSNISCINKDCENYINIDDEITYINILYKDNSKLSAKNFQDIDEKDYSEEYDDLLFFSDVPGYISRFEYREMNDFIENDLFHGKKISYFKKYLNNNKVDDFELVSKKYDIITEGRKIEKENRENAYDFYSSYLNNHLFKNDYYIYKKLVIFENNPEKQFDLIISFFNKGIYCDRYHYLWFLKKLHDISLKINVSLEDIEDALLKFKENGFTKRKFQDVPVHIAEKITLNKNVLKIRTDKEYTLREFKFELQQEANDLKKIRKYEFANQILIRLILDYGFKPSKVFKEICNNYHKLGQYENELKWIYAFFNKSKRFNNPYDEFFLKRLTELDVKITEFNHQELFFDDNDYYLSNEEFKNKKHNPFDIAEYIALIKDKYAMILKGRTLEKDNPKEAIDYYYSILNHELFKNDYYVYKKLIFLHDDLNKFETEIDLILSFFDSGIYCDRYHYLLFIVQLKKLSLEFEIYEDEINDSLKLYKEKSFNNKYLENTPAPLSERLVIISNILNIIPGEQFQIEQEIKALNMEYDLFQANLMFDSANDILKILLNEYEINDVGLYKQICFNYSELNDVESEIKIIECYLDNELSWNLHEQKWFEDRLIDLKRLKNNFQPINEPTFEIFYENHENYLTHHDFKSNNINLNELIDNTLLKSKIRLKGKLLELNDYEKAINYYESFLHHDLFKNDYYIYRRLVMTYENINEYELVLKTIKEFFHSGIYCNRYHYLWFLHKLYNVSRVMCLYNEEITDCLKSFKENGFLNAIGSNFLAERLYLRNSLRITSYNEFENNQKKYELKEEARQLEINHLNIDSVKILRKMLENNCIDHPRDYMRLCHAYRRLNELDEELFIINLYLSNKHGPSRYWFEKRLKEVEKLIKENNRM